MVYNYYMIYNYGEEAKLSLKRHLLELGTLRFKACEVNSDRSQTLEPLELQKLQADPRLPSSKAGRREHDTIYLLGMPCQA